MEKLREKRQAMQVQLEEIETRDMLAKKKLNWLEEITAKNQNETDTLRRSCTLTEHNLDKTEDLLDHKIQTLKDALLKGDKEDQVIKVLEQRDCEIDEEISRFEPKVKQAIHRADEAEMKYHEAVRKLSLAESERNKVLSRRNVKESQVNVLETSLKNAGRQIHRLEISEEKSGDREDEYFRRCRHLTDNVSHCLMRAEEAERRIRMLQKTKDNLEEEKNTYEKNHAMMKRELDETLNSLDHV
jgi:chromosome segregation ATPase